MECPSCEREIPVWDVDAGSRLARCTACDRGYHVEPGGSLSELRAPERWEIRAGDGTFEIRRTWRRSMGGMLLVFAAVWIGILGFAASTVSSTPTPGVVIGVLSCAGLPFLLIGLGFLYTAVAYLVNTTVYRLADEQFRVEHGPLYWPGAEPLDLSDIRQMYGKKLENDNQQWFQLRAVETSGRERGVAGKLERQEAAFLERALEHRLGIVDREVGGEMEPPVLWQGPEGDAAIGGRLECPRCGRHLTAAEVDVDAGSAACEECGSVLRGAPSGGGGWEEGDVPVPESWEIERDGSVMEITDAWSRVAGGTFAGFSLFWLAAAALVAYLGPEATESGSVVAFSLGLAVIAGIGLAMLYCGLAQLVNRTTLRIDDRGLERTYGPLPWPGDRRIPASEIRGIRCEHRTEKREDDIHHLYVVVVERKDGSDVDWFSSGSENESLFVRQRARERMELGPTDDSAEGAEPSEEW